MTKKDKILLFISNVNDDEDYENQQNEYDVRRFLKNFLS